MRKFTETVKAIREAAIQELKEKDQKEYAEFFAATLKKYGVKSPNELDDEEKKKFFEEIDKGWDGTNESSNEVNEGTTPQFKKLIKRAKELKIETADELSDLISDEFSDESAPITGADFEIAKKTLKLDESEVNEGKDLKSNPKFVEYSNELSKSNADDVVSLLMDYVRGTVKKDAVLTKLPELGTKYSKSNKDKVARLIADTYTLIKELNESEVNENRLESVKYITFSKPTKHNLIQIYELFSNTEVNPYVNVTDISFKYKDGMTVSIEETENTEVDKFISLIESQLEVKTIDKEAATNISLNEGITIFEYINTLDLSDVDKFRLAEAASKRYPIPTHRDMIYWEVAQLAATLGIERF